MPPPPTTHPITHHRLPPCTTTPRRHPHQPPQTHHPQALMVSFISRKESGVTWLDGLRSIPHAGQGMVSLRGTGLVFERGTRQHNVAETQ